MDEQKSTSPTAVTPPSSGPTNSAASAPVPGSAIPSAAPTSPTPPTPPTSPMPPMPPTPPASVPSGSHKWTINFFVALVTLLLGIVLGFLLFRFLPKNLSQESVIPAKTSESTSITLPPDAVKIQACANRKGALYVQPNNIPVGPVYMVYNGKVIGIEFMLSRDEFLSGKNYEFLSGLGVKVDHVNMGLLSQGHEGYTIPHYHVDMYLVSPDEEKNITCPGSQTPTQSASPSGTLKTLPTTTVASPSSSL